jgi:phosphoenolpyruvate phosphomutase
VIVPTKYYSTQTEVFRQNQVSLVIWANHLIRAGITAMQNTARTIYESESLVDVEGRVATVPEIFRLQGADELLEAEKIYARSARNDASAIILAASRGRGMDELTRDKPKVMIPVAGQTVLRRLVDKFKLQGINEITVVGGYFSDAIDTQGVNVVINDQWESSDELVSLSCALDTVAEDTVLLYGDLLFRSYILNTLVDWDSDLLVVVDSSPLDGAKGNKNDLAYCSAPDDRAMYQQKVSLDRISADPQWEGRKPDGRWIGMLRASGAGKTHLLEALSQLKSEKSFETKAVPDLINRLVENGHTPQVQYISGHWMDINNLDDLQRAGDFAYHHDA